MKHRNDPRDARPSDPHPARRDGVETAETTSDGGLDAQLDNTLARLSAAPPRRPSRRRRTAAGILLGGALLAGGIVATTASPGGALPICCIDGPVTPLPPVTLPPVTTPPTPPPPPPTTATWFIDANTLHVLDAQEESFWSNGDEFYIAQIGFRSTPGKVGSTTAWFQGGLSEITGLDDGDWATIPDAMGRVAFPNVTLRGQNDVYAGNNPEVIGSISVAFESDWTSFSSIGSMMNDVKNVVRSQIASLVEPLRLTDLSDPDLMAQRLATTTTSIKNATELSTWNKITTFLSSFGDPDDKIGFNAQVFVAADPTLAADIDSKFGMNFPTTAGTAGSLRDRSFTENFKGDGANYDVTYRVGR